MSGLIRPGDVVAGKFQVERVLGEGGMGYVLAARHMQLGQLVALKFMREEVCTPDYKSRFLREARNTVRLKSKHVTRVLDVGVLDGGAPYMVMEYLEGTDLSDLLQLRGAFPVHEACEYVIQACEAIAEAHGHGIVHRDLKPANLFLTRGTGGEPVVKVLDFGVSKLLELGEDDTSSERRRHPDSVVTKASDLLGSPSYMAPEQVISARDADVRSDVWSLGVILFRLVSGRPPFYANSLGELIQAIMHGPMPNLRAARPDIPAGLEYVVARCIERDRNQRLGDVVELARLLAPYAGPVATPSVERIAILGPTLVTAAPPIMVTSSSNVSAGVWSAPPPAPPRARREMSATSMFIWGSLFFIVVACLALMAAKIVATRKSAASHDVGSPPSAILPPPPPPMMSVSSETLPKVTPPPASVAPPATVAPTKPGHGGGHPRRPQAPKNGEIPSSRE